MTTSVILSSAHPAPIECVTAVKRLWDYLDGRLSSMAHEEVEAHLAACAQCPPHFTFAHSMRAALGSLTTPSAATSDERLLRGRVRDALRRLETENGSVR